MFDSIDKNTLKPGDVVGIRVKTQIGWGFFRYPKTIPLTIERITPARTEFVMTNGSEFGRRDSFYPITAETNNQTHVAECAEKIHTALMTLDELRRREILFKQNDDFIVKTAECLEQIIEEVKNLEIE